MTSSSLDLTSRADLGWLAELVRDAQSSAPNETWLLVGAMARDVWLFYAHGIPTERATTDVDLALAIESWNEFHVLHERLVASGRFLATRIEHRLQHVSGRLIDIVPFGNVADDRGVVAWPPDGAMQMNVLGYREALASSWTMRLPGDVGLRVVSLPALVLLKIRAWAERSRDQPRKDAYDLRAILGHYLAAGNQDRLYAQYAEWLKRDDFDYEIAGAELAGVDVRALLLQHSPRAADMIRALENILEPEIDPEGTNRLVGEIPLVFADAFRRQLAAFLQGLSGKLD